MTATPEPPRLSAGIPRQLEAADGGLRLDGRSYQLLAGELHYFRVHPQLWADRLSRLAAMGLNAVDTYVPWNFHAPQPDQVSFEGWRDLGRFLDLAQDAGLLAIVRPGPYICAEWDNGGLPAWLQFDGPMPLRCSDSRFLAAVDTWFDAVLPIVVPRQLGRGGPVAAIQVENEYGSYGDDSNYLAWLRDALVHRGVDCLLLTADGPTDLMQDAGSLPEVLATATFGANSDQARRTLARRRPGSAFVCMEFWNGWFDHWGEPHHVRSADSAVATLAEIVRDGGSVSIYPAHGGTNFGLWSGANLDGDTYLPTITSYDSDAPIAEDGTLTAKFESFRQVLMPIRDRQQEPIVVAAVTVPPQAAPQTLTQTAVAALLPTLEIWSDEIGGIRTAPHPLTCEQLRQASGLTVYTAHPVLPPGPCQIGVDRVLDRAQLWIDRIPVGVFDRNHPGHRVTVQGNHRPVELTLVVENQGRVNYGNRLGEHKGILGGVLVDRRLVHTWQHRPLDLNSLDLNSLDLNSLDLHSSDLNPVAGSVVPGGVPPAAPTHPQVAEFACHLAEPADAFLAFPHWRKGFAWVNGFLLGRYWERGPQQTLYAPAPLWKAGRNDVVVLELERAGDAPQIVDQPELGPPEEYIEVI